MKLRKLRQDTPLEGTRVLVRIDGNVPIVKGRAVDGPNGRIARAAVDLDWLIRRGARVVVMTHLGRPAGKRRSAYSVKPIGKRLSNLLGIKVPVSGAIIGPHAKRMVDALKNGQLLLLENLRFDPREEQNDPAFAAELAALGDLYINDAFSVSHRAHTSVSALARLLPSYAGHLLANEVGVLSVLESKVRRPLVLLMGGVKVETKLPIIEHLATLTDQVLLGGALATTFFAARGIAVGRSLVDEAGVEAARALSKSLIKKICLPVDVVVASSLRRDAKTRVADATDVGARERIVDIGPNTRAAYAAIIGKAKTVVWNGPFGYCEVGAFCEGTASVARAVAARTGAATTIVGGGDTGPVLERLKLADQFTLLSTGGGALLDFLSGRPMPGVDLLRIAD